MTSNGISDALRHLARAAQADPRDQALLDSARRLGQRRQDADDLRALKLRSASRDAAGRAAAHARWSVPRRDIIREDTIAFELAATATALAIEEGISLDHYQQILRRRNRSQSHALRRRQFVRLAHRRGVPSGRIAAYIDRDHTIVAHYLKQEGYLET